MSNDVTVRVHGYGPGRALGLVWFDPVSGKKRAKSSGTTDPREAERLAGELERQLRAGAAAVPSRVTWAAFRERYREQKLAALAPATRVTAEVALGHVERVMGPDRFARVTTAFLATLQSRLRAEGMGEATIARNLRHVKAALNWAHAQGLLASAPRIDMPRRARGSAAKGRPITVEELERMLDKVAVVRPRDAAAWAFLLRGLWLSGLRIGEAVALSWDPEAAFSVDLDRRRPAFVIRAEAQKSYRDEVLPMTPDFAALLAEVPREERQGPVFKLGVLANEATRIVAAIGRAAGVVVNKAKGKTASAHDLRRSFGTRWATKVMPAVLQRLMRHADIKTTMAYYVDLDAEAIGDQLWAAERGPAGNAAVGNILGNTGPKPALETVPRKVL